MADLDAFRAEVAAWLEASCPASMRTPVHDPSELVYGGRRGTFPSDDARTWLAAMAERGWIAPRWPVELGGAGLDGPQARVLAEELRRIGARPPLVSIHGLGMIGPTLLEHGSPEQRQRFLPDIATGRVRWCQGFSEPGAGSDLAGVSTRAVREGDEYVVTGQKVWTSFAEDSDWIFVLARTDPAAPKRDGLSFLLVDLTTPGIEVRPITLISGGSEFCEVFLDEVRVPVANRLGAEGDGWPITRFVLGNERQLLGQDTGFTAGRLGPKELVALARERLGVPSGPLPDGRVRDALAAVDIEQTCSRALLRSGAPHPSVVKLVMSSMMQHQADLAVEVLGADGLGWEGDAFAGDHLAVTRDNLYARTWTIAGGSSEIQRNVLARQVLQLPHLGPEVG